MLKCTVIILSHHFRSQEMYRRFLTACIHTIYRRERERGGGVGGGGGGREWCGGWGGGETKHELLSGILWPFSSFLDTCCACMDNIGLNPTQSLHSCPWLAVSGPSSRPVLGLLYSCVAIGDLVRSRAITTANKSWWNHGAPSPPHPDASN